MTNKNKCLIILILTIVFLIIFNIKVKMDNKIFNEFFNNKKVYTITNYSYNKDLPVLADNKIEIIDYNKLKINNMKKWKYNINIINNTLYTDYDVKQSDEIKLYWINKTGKVYITELNSYLDLPKDEYALYIKLNNTIYNTNNIYIY